MFISPNALTYYVGSAHAATPFRLRRARLLVTAGRTRQIGIPMMNESELLAEVSKLAEALEKAMEALRRFRLSHGADEGEAIT